MDKTYGSLFGAAASATRMLTVPMITLTWEEIGVRVALAAIVAIPGALMGYLVTLLCKTMHKRFSEKIENWRERKNLKKRTVRRFRKPWIFALIAVILSSALIPITIHTHNHNSGNNRIAAGANLSNIHIDKKQESKILVVVIGGHGRTSGGKYPTPGKQSPEWPDSLGCLKIYEGDSNHKLAFALSNSLVQNDIDVELITYKSIDLSLYRRVWMVNNIDAEGRTKILISLHHNAQADIGGADYYDHEGFHGWFSPATGGATGTEVFTSPGQTGSDLIAQYIIEELMKEFPEMCMRTDESDGDLDKEAPFTVLSKTNCLAVLVEWMFMTTYTDCEFIDSQNNQERYIKAITNAFVRYNDMLNEADELYNLNIAA